MSCIAEPGSSANSNNNVVLYKVSIAVLNLYSITALIWYWIRRDKFPIKARKAYFVLVEELALLVTCTMSLSNGIGLPFSCAAYGVFTYLSAYITIFVILSRVTLLYAWTVFSHVAYESATDDFNFEADHAEAGATIRKKNRKTKKRTEQLRKRFYTRLDNWVMEHKKYFSPQYMAIYSSVLVLISCIPFIAVFGKFPDIASSDVASGTCISGLTYLNYMLVFLILLISLFCCILSLGFFGAIENFRLVEDFKAMALMTAFLIFILLMQTSTRYFQLISCRWGIQSWLIGFVPGMLFTTFILYRVIYWSYKAEEDRAKLEKMYGEMNSNVKKSLEPGAKLENANMSGSVRRFNLLESDFQEMLNDSKGFLIFKRFLVSEFSVENCLFWRAATAFKSYYSSDEHKENRNYRRVALRIYDKYIGNDSKYQINIPFVLKANIEKDLGITTNRKAPRVEPAERVDLNPDEIKELEKINPQIFDDAVREICNLMFSDSFRRFVLTEVYRDWRMEKELEKQRPHGNESKDTIGNLTIKLKAVAEKVSKRGNEIADDIKPAMIPKRFSEGPVWGSSSHRSNSGLEVVLPPRPSRAEDAATSASPSSKGETLQGVSIHGPVSAGTI